MRRLYRRYKAPNCEKSSERNTEANGLLMEGTNRRLASLVYTSVTRATEDHGPATGPIDRMRISACIPLGFLWAMLLFRYLPLWQICSNQKALRDCSERQV